MFDFLFQDKKGDMQSLLDIIALSIDRLQIAELAQSKARRMIANAIAKSEIVVYDGKGRVVDENYFRLNVRPNDNQTGTEFWSLVTHKLLKRGECLIIPIAGKYYIAQSWSTTNMVMLPKTYYGITLTDGKDTFRLDRVFPADDVMHLHYDTYAMHIMRAQVMKMYGDTASAINALVKTASTPKYKYKVDASLSFKTRNADGTIKNLTIDDVIKRLTDQLKDNSISIIPEQNGTSLEYMQLTSSVASSELKSVTDIINEETAKLYDIPIGVYNGQITEQSDATNEFLTYAVQPVAQTITDAMNSQLVGDKGYIKGERIFVWLANFKHRDVLDAAGNMDKLRSDGWTLDEIRTAVGYEPLNTEFSTERALTKNYAAEGEEGGSDGSSEDPEEPDKNSSQKLSKHAERRLRRYEGSKVLPAGGES